MIVVCVYYGLFWAFDCVNECSVNATIVIGVTRKVMYTIIWRCIVFGATFRGGEYPA